MRTQFNTTILEFETSSVQRETSHASHPEVARTRSNLTQVQRGRHDVVRVRVYGLVGSWILVPQSCWLFASTSVTCTSSSFPK